jgi:hypothetical protein
MSAAGKATPPKRGRGRPPGSKNKPKAPADVTVDSNTKRDLAAIAGDIHALERRSIFDIGKLLIEARDACAHGEWGHWLDREFDWSDDTADNYMDAARLADKFRTVRNLKVPKRVIYDDLAADIDDPDLPAIIDALAKASKSKSISVAEADEVITLMRRRIEFGDYPPATLAALVYLNNFEWGARAAEDLKKAAPTTSEAVEPVTRPHYRAHVEALYGSPLPAWLDSEMLGSLEEAIDDPDLKDAAARDERRKRIPQQLNAAPTPLDSGQVIDIAYADAFDGGDDRDDKEADEPPPRPALRPPRPEPKTQETSSAEAAAAEAARSDIGPLSQAEHERLTTTIADLTSQNNMQKTAIAGRDNEIARLEDEVKTLKGADLPTLTISKHLDALIALLKKQSREGQEVAIERLCNELKIDPHKLNIGKEAA